MFPAHLGKISTTNKRERLLQELKVHMNLRTSGSKSALNMDYLEPLREAITGPLVSKGLEGIPQTLDMMNNYCLRKEDLDNIIELSLFRGQEDPMSKVEPKIKGALTRTINKDGQLLPYAVEAVQKAKRGAAGSASDEGGFGEMGGESQETEDPEEEAGNDEDDIKNDPTIRVKKVSKKDTNKGKGKGRGKSKAGDDSDSETEKKPPKGKGRGGGTGSRGGRGRGKK
jgi:replication factor C subunit 1